MRYMLVLKILSIAIFLGGSAAFAGDVGGGGQLYEVEVAEDNDPGICTFTGLNQSVNFGDVASSSLAFLSPANPNKNLSILITGCKKNRNIIRGRVVFEATGEAADNYMIHNNGTAKNIVSGLSVSGKTTIWQHMSGIACQGIYVCPGQGISTPVSDGNATLSFKISLGLISDSVQATAGSIDSTLTIELEPD